MDEFQLYDLRVEVVCPPGKRIMCGAKEGDYFTLKGEMMYLPPGQGISIYSLASVLPLLASKQRMTHENDWMTTDASIACPDPHCPSQLKIIRTVFANSAHCAGNFAHHSRNVSNLEFLIDIFDEGTPVDVLTTGVATR